MRYVYHLTCSQQRYKNILFKTIKNIFVFKLFYLYICSNQIEQNTIIMKIKVQKTTVKNVELEVEIPFYKKSLCHFFKVYSETHAIMVCNLQGHEQISILGISLALHDTIDCDHVEFQENYDNVINILNKNI